AEIDVVEALQQFHQLNVGLLQVFVIADHSAVARHQLTQLTPDPERVFRSTGGHEASVKFLLPLFLRIKYMAAHAVSGFAVLGIKNSLRAGHKSAVDTGDQRVCAQAVGAMNAEVALAAGEDAFDAGGLVAIHPKAAHGVMHARKDLHGHVARIIAHKFLVNLQNAFQLAVQRLTVNVRQVEIDNRLAINAKIVLVNNFVDSACRYITGDQIAVLGIPLFQKIPALG